MKVALNGSNRTVHSYVSNELGVGSSSLSAADDFSCGCYLTAVQCKSSTHNHDYN